MNRMGLKAECVGDSATRRESAVAEFLPFTPLHPGQRDQNAGKLADGRPRRPDATRSCGDRADAHALRQIRPSELSTRRGSHLRTSQPITLVGLRPRPGFPAGRLGTLLRMVYQMKVDGSDIAFDSFRKQRGGRTPLRPEPEETLRFSGAGLARPSSDPTRDVIAGCHSPLVCLLL